MKSINYEHAAQRKTLVGYVYSKGSHFIKDNLLERLDKRFSKLHADGTIHIHDMEAYGQSYNCLTPNILQDFPYEEFKEYSTHQKIMHLFYYYRQMIVGLGNEQSGGIAFPNFDNELDVILTKLEIPMNSKHLEFLKVNIDLFLKWLNEARDRCGQVQYYVTLNLGLSTSKIGRYVTKTVLTCFMNSDYIRPNIIFKVKSAINRQKEDDNYDLFSLAKQCTCKKMIPTYYLADSDHNQQIDPYKISIMGCRSKVYQNQHGEDTTIGKTNVVYSTINLPRIALDIINQHPNIDQKQRIQLYKQNWFKIAEDVKDQLLDRFYKICQLSVDDFPTNQAHHLMFKNISKVDTLKEVFKHGTLAIGFIGLSETIELLTGEKYFYSEENHHIAIDLVKMMRNSIDQYRAKYNKNFSLLATSGEFISGRFPDIDKKYHTHALINKGFYTNSFHVDVDVGLNPFDKLKFEGPFHKFCNGGCISYIEFQSAPINNVEAISELIEYAIDKDVNYLGFNYPLDRCLECGYSGTYDICEKCNSNNIQRIRRVSGYLENAEFFTQGKKAELAHRTPNFQNKKR